MILLWLAANYSIAFGPANDAIWGGLDKAFLAAVDAESLSGTLPEVLFFAFQMTFAIITSALIVGNYLDRIGFAFILTFSGPWMLICYAPVVTLDLGGGIMADGGISARRAYAIL